MNIWFNRIQLLCDQHNVKFCEVEKALGFSKNLIYKWTDSIPKCDKIIKISIYFDVSTDYILGITDNPQSHKNPVLFSKATLNELNNALCNINLAEENVEHALKSLYLVDE